MSQPFVSIVVPSFNQAQFLEQCLCSILNQDYPNIEVIVIDGGSTDSSVEIIRRYQDRLAYWVSEEDNGQSHAINKGFRRAQGDIVAWLNSDDVYLPGAVSCAVGKFLKNNRLSLFYGDSIYLDEQGSFLRYFSEVETWDQARLLNFTDFIMQPTTFFKREKLIQVGMLDETLHYGMDWDLWCKLSATGDVHYEPRVIAANREYGETKTSSGSWSRLRELFKVQRRHMTGLWPHAFCGFLATEFHLKADHAKSTLFSKALHGVGYFAQLLAPFALYQNRKRLAQRTLYGLRHHSPIVPGGKAFLYMPLVETALALIVTFRADKFVNVVIESPDSSRTVKASGIEMSLRVPVGHEMKKQAIAVVSIRFFDQHSMPVAGEVLAAVWEHGPATIE